MSMDVLHSVAWADIAFNLTTAQASMNILFSHKATSLIITVSVDIFTYTADSLCI